MSDSPSPRRDLAPGYTWEILGCAPHEVAEVAERLERPARPTPVRRPAPKPARRWG